MPNSLNDFNNAPPRALLPATRAARRVACPGSREMEAAYPSEKTAKSLEGETAHEVAQLILKNNAIKEGELCKKTSEYINSEMLECAEFYKKNIVEIAGINTTDLFSGNSDCVFAIEKTYNIRSINNECWGTPDFWIFKTGVLYIFDYKYGHAPVEVFENWQLIEYAAGILDELGINGVKDALIKVVFVIVQPRYFAGENVKKWVTYASDLRPYFNILRNAENEALKSGAEFRTSSQCRNCSACHACPALQDAAFSVFDFVQNGAPRDLDSYAVGFALKRLNRGKELITNLIQNLEMQALSFLQAGKPVPYYELGEIKKNLQWTIAPEEAQEWSILYNINLLQPPKLITPAQAKAAGLHPQILKNFTRRPIGEKKLIEVDTKIAKQFFNQKN